MVVEHFQFNHAAVAGTFDRLHLGHKALLLKAFSHAKHVSVGITSQQMVQDKTLSGIVLPYDLRLSEVQQFLSSQNLLDKATLLQINDIYGSALTDQTLEALVVSSKTIAGANEVNKKREGANLKPLIVIVADYITSDDNDYLSSTRIRLGEITREGHTYQDFLKSHAPFTIPTQLRLKLKDPIGTVFEGSENEESIAVTKAATQISEFKFVYVVGDVVMRSFMAQGLPINLAIFDNKNKRGPLVDQLPEKDKTVSVVTNTPGTISQDAIAKIIDLQKKVTTNKTPQFLKVFGEEDLLVLPLILTAPLMSAIYYGQSDRGIVMVKVTEEEKAKTENFLKQCL